MNRKEFDQYLTYFNTKNYEKALSYFSKDFVIRFAGYQITRREGFLSFYNFFHSIVNEQIEVLQFASDEENVIIDVNVRLEGLKALAQSALDAEGFGRLVAPKVGEVITIPQMIHYRINDGKFDEVRCVIKDLFSSGQSKSYI